MNGQQTLAGYRFARAEGMPMSGMPVLALHKTGSSVEETIALVQQVAPHSPVIAPEGNVLEGERRRFFARHEDGSFDVDDLLARATALVTFAETLPEENAGRPFLFGISHGANIAAAMLLERPNLFSGAVLIRLAGLPPTLPSTPLEGGRLLVVSGSADQTVPEPQSAEAVARLTALGGDVDHRFVAAGHAVVPEDLDIARDWLASVMAPSAAQTLQWRH